ncbi:CRISPR-associated protein, Csd1 family [Paenibacillaceae bacterium GAS479]|nr:CRISPR-associated protein, Csd1 family [Paenibacillaceae bacterium GAS479]
MIIQALHQRYLDLAADPDSGVSPLYFSSGKATYLLTLSREGELMNVQDIRLEEGKKKRPRIFIVPEQKSRASNIFAYFLCDKAEYILGHHPILPSDQETEKKRSDAREKFEEGRKLARKVLKQAEFPLALALLRFYDAWDPDAVRKHPTLQPFMENLDKGIDTNMIFCLESATALLHEEREISDAWVHYCAELESATEYKAQCLLTGQVTAIARLHDKIKGVRGALAAGASLVSFNFPSAESYGKEKSYNSPVSKTAVFGYITALNHLLASARNRTWIGDMTIVFWSGAVGAEELESFLIGFVEQNQTPKEDGWLTQQLEDVLERARKGQKLENDMIPGGETPFYVLGLAPNNGRVAVRFFWQGNFGDLVQKLAQHAADLEMAGMEERYNRGIPSIYQILSETMRVGGDGKKVGDGPPPLLGGALMRSVIQGMAYPFSLYNLIINRIRADGIVNGLRASILKAYLNRYRRINRDNANIREELTDMLDEQAQEPAYRLGRLFAVLEKAQQEAASGKLNATIKDRYFSSASSNPAAVFPILLRLAQHHMSKSKYGDFRDRDLTEIMQGLDTFPTNLDLQRQGIFVIGYYHQKHYMFEQIKAAADSKKEAAAASAMETKEV